MTFFFSSLFSSLYNARWISAMRKEKKKAITYFFFFVLIASLFQSVPVTRVLYQGVDRAGRWVSEQLPDFTAEIKNGELSVSGIDIPFEKELADGYFLIVDSSGGITDEKIAEKIGDRDGGVVAFSKTEAAMHEIRSGVRRTNRLSWGEVGDNTLTKAQVLSFIEKIKGPAKFGITAGWLVLTYALFLVGKAVYLLFASFVVFIIGKIGKREVNYGEIYIMGLYAITLPTVLAIIAQLFGIRVPYIYTIILISLLVAATWVKVEAPPTEPTAPSEPS